MAEIQPEGKPVEDDVSSRPGRHFRFSAAQDIAIVREVAAARAHIPKYGETRKRYALVAEKVNANESFEDEPVTWKAVQDRYKRLQEQYDKCDNENQRLSGVGGGEMGELADLLMSMREAKDDWDAQKKALETAEKKKEEDKERMGRSLMDAATKRRSGTSDSEDGVYEDSGDGNDSEPEKAKRETPRKGKKRKVSNVASDGVDSELDRFGSHLKDADIARVELEREKLAFEQERAAADRIEREKEREERRLEREDERRERREERVEQQKLELEKFKAMIDAFNRNK